MYYEIASNWSSATPEQVESFKAYLTSCNPNFQNIMVSCARLWSAGTFIDVYIKINDVVVAHLYITKDDHFICGDAFEQCDDCASHECNEFCSWGI